MMVGHITHIKLGKYVSSMLISTEMQKSDGAKMHDVPPTGLVKAPLRVEGKCERQAVMPVNIIFGFSRQRLSVLLDQLLESSTFLLSPKHSLLWRGCLSVLPSAVLSAINKMCQNCDAHAGL